MPPTPKSAVSRRRVSLLIAVGAGLLAATVALTATRWVGTTFPGFFVLANRVVPSIMLADWRDGDPSRLFQHEVVAVDGTPVDSSDAVYAYVRSTPPGTHVRYTVRSPEGRTSIIEVPTRRFSAKDYVLVFGAYLLNGVVFVAAGLLAFLLNPRSAASAGLLSLGLTTGVFVLTAGDLYGPHWFFRLHVIAESLLAASFIHLALVFPTDRIRGQRSSALQAVYLPFAAFAAIYETVLYWPIGYSVVHLVATATHSMGAMVWIAAVLHDLCCSRSAIVRRAILVVALGTLAAFLAPAMFWATSAILNGSVPLNAAALTAYFFPLSVGYAIARQGLLEIGDRVPGAVRAG